MRTIKSFSLVFLLLIALVSYFSVYVVKEGQNALLLRLGNLVIDAKTNQPKIVGPGLHFQAPLLNQVRIFDVRLQTMSAQSSRVLTEEQKYVLVDYYAKWRISNLPLYFTRTDGFSERAQVLLQQKINDALRATFGKLTITEVISGERGNMMILLKSRANDSAKYLGIEVVDVRIKGIDLPEEVSSSVFDRMRAEREQVATKHRSNGKAVSEAVRADADAEVIVTLAKAEADAARVRAEGIAQAASIYSKAYNKNPSFYAFYRSLEAYKSIFNSKNDLLLIKPDSQFFKYFDNAQGGQLAQ